MIKVFRTEFLLRVLSDCDCEASIENVMKCTKVFKAEASDLDVFSSTSSSCFHLENLHSSLVFCRSCKESIILTVVQPYPVSPPLNH